MSFGITKIGLIKCATALFIFLILLPVSFADDTTQTDSESGKYMYSKATVTGASWAEAVTKILTQNGVFNTSSTEKENGCKGVSVLETEDSSYIVLAEIFERATFGPGMESKDILLMKTDSNGTEVWNRTFGGDDWDQGYSIQKTSDGGYIISGITKSYGTDDLDGLLSPDVWLIKTDSYGDEIWNRTFGGPEYDAGNFVQESSDGGYFVAGDTSSYGSGKMDAWIIKTDSEGAEEWNKTFGGGENDGGKGALATEDGGCVLIYNKESSVDALGNDAVLIKIDSDGDEIWSKKFGGTGDQFGQSVRASEDEGHIIGGYNSLGKDPWLAKTNSDGKKGWEWDLNDIFSMDPNQRVFNAKDGGFTSISPKVHPSYTLYDFQVTRDGGYIILSRNPAREVCLTKVNPNGTEVWNNTYSKYDTRWGYSVLETNDGGYMITGSQANDLCLMKTDSEGSKEWNRIYLVVPEGLKIDTQERTLR